MRTAVISMAILSSVSVVSGAYARDTKPARRHLPPPALNGNQSAENAIGMVEVYLFKNRKITQRCAATHVGDGLMVTSGHCFLGAYDCNDARVTWHGESFTSRCQYVLYSNASEAYASGQEISNDLTVFKVDRFPQARVNLARKSDTDSTSTQTSAEAIAISTSHNNGTTTTRTSHSCQIVFGPVVNIFAQPKAPDTARHNCELSEIASGSPLINVATQQLVALHQGTSLLPTFEDSNDAAASTKVNYAKVISENDIHKAINFPTALPADIRIGGFAGEVFPTGIKEPLNMRIASIQARPGQTTVSFSVHNGLDTVLEAIDGRGKKHVFAGPRRAGHDQRFRLTAPVKFILTSAPNGLAPLAWIENIQSP